MSYLSELTITFRKTLITGWTWTFFGILKTHIIAIHMLLISTFHPSLNVVYCCIMNCHATNFVHIWIPFWMVIFSSFICEFKMLFTGLGNQSFKMNTLKLVQLVKSRILPNYCPTVQLQYLNILLPFVRWQGAILFGPQTLSDGICVVQQLEDPPGRVSQPCPPHVPQLSAQHTFPLCIPRYMAHLCPK